MSTFSVENARHRLEETYRLGLAQKAYGLLVKDMTQRDLIGLIGLLCQQLEKTCPLYKTIPIGETNGTF